MLRIFFLLPIFIAFSNQSYAEKFLELGPDLGLSYKTGNIDANSINGFAADVSLIYNDQLIGTAKTLKIESQKNKEGEIIVNSLSMNEFFAFSDEFEFEIFVDKIFITDFNFDNLFKEHHSESNYNLLKHKNFSFNISGVNFNFLNKIN